MKNNQVNLPEPYSGMLENYDLAKRNMPLDHKSEHWDVFPEDYEQTITCISAWETFLRNPISLGFNDSLIKFDNSRWKENTTHQGVDAWKRKTQSDYTELVSQIIENTDEKQHLMNLANLFFSACGPEFVTSNVQSHVGSPRKLSLTYSQKQDSPQTFSANAHDLGNIYYFWQITRTMDSLLDDESPTFVEIGAGYGGVISKMKKKYPNARCILFDLPELVAVQSYYLHKCFPKSKILYLKELLEFGGKIFESNFDFMILPGWMIEKLPSNYTNLVINMRSMMEMSLSVIDYYFHHIHRITKVNGLFACFNRYHKNSFGEDIIMKKYPYDEFWSIILSQSSIYQNHIHELILKREDKKNSFPVSERLKSLPPF